MGRVSDLARRAGGQGFHRRPLRHRLSVQGHPRLPRFLFRPARRRRDARFLSSRLRPDRAGRARARPDGAAARLEAALSRRQFASLRTRERARSAPARLTCNRNRAAERVSMTHLRPAQPLSVLRYSPALLAFIIVVADAGRWADPDLWGHLVFGRLILTHGHLPPRDIYS